jgi:enoyl-CoA hydratase/carnithine racemase
MRTDRGYWCLPEADLGMPLADGMNDLIRARLTPPVAHEAILTARRYTAEEAHAAGIVQAAVAEEAVLDMAVARAGDVASNAGEHLTQLRSTLYREVLSVLDEARLPPA